LAGEKRINTRLCTNRLRADYGHVGLYDVEAGAFWIARRRLSGPGPLRLSHAGLLLGAAADRSTAEKDRFLCYWFHTPGTGEGYVQGYPIEWEEGHLLVRSDPQWDYSRQQVIPSTHHRRVERNLDRQFAWGQKIFEAYLARGPRFPLSWHMIGPRPADSMFYVQRVEHPAQHRRK
jgi:hypothetical protein